MDQYAVIGYPIAHSKSPRIHQLFAEQQGEQLCYRSKSVEPGLFVPTVRQFFANQGKGLNITVPFKEEAWRLVDQRTPRAQLAGAVNTIKPYGEGVLLGDNTDGIGLVRDLRRLGCEVRGRRIVLLGAGGAARGVLAPLLQQQPEALLVVNRTLAKAEALQQLVVDQGRIQVCDYAGLEVADYDGVINATAASLQGEVPTLPQNLLQAEGCAYDMMYGAVTPFMQWAAQQGCQRIHDGLGMLVEQAAEAFVLWRGMLPETAPVIAQLRQELADV